MKILILEDAQAVTLRAADIVSAQIRTLPNAVLGLATGGTMMPLYNELVRRNHAGEFSLAGISTFNLDEYVGLPPDHPGSYHQTMLDALFKHTDIRAEATHLPRGDASDPCVEAQRYEACIAKAGGIDLQLLGIGANGHIGFNEPTSSLGSRTRVKTLTEATRDANQQFFNSQNLVPRYAITMGIATILEARTCLLLATGRAKATAVAAMVEGPVSAACPASALQMHPKVTVVLDHGAASELQMTDYYHQVHPNGDDFASP